MDISREDTHISSVPSPRI